MDYAKFNKTVNIEELKAGIEEAKERGTGEYPEVPANRTYYMSIESMELGESKKNDPMVKVQFKILKGDYAKQRLFMNQVVTQGFQIHIVNEFLRSLDTDVEVGFENFQQYGIMIEEIFEKVHGKLAYDIEYKVKNGFANFTVVDVYDIEPA